MLLETWYPPLADLDWEKLIVGERATYSVLGAIINDRESSSPKLELLSVTHFFENYRAWWGKAKRGYFSHDNNHAKLNLEFSGI